jgi:hypothetical protein
MTHTPVRPSAEGATPPPAAIPSDTAAGKRRLGPLYVTLPMANVALYLV